MRYIVDHDLHLHSRLSLCSNDPGQSTDAILRYGEDAGLPTLCLTDHMWDNAVPLMCGMEFYERQDQAHIAAALPLPQSDRVRFLFGCETDLDRHLTLGITKELMDKLDFVIIPTTHLHMNGFTCAGDEGVEERARLWCTRFEAVLDMELPFRKVGIAHLTCELMHRGHHIAVLNAIPTEEYRRLFAKAAAVGVGIELNFDSFAFSGAELETMLLPYRIAKEEGCRFYFGSDAHHPAGLASARANFEHIVDLLDLTEEDKFRLPGM